MKNGENIQYEIIDGHPYLVLFRKDEYSKTENCHFCGFTHQHGVADGHRVSHCHNKDGIALVHNPVKIVVGSRNGKDIVTSSNDGYIVKTLKIKTKQKPTHPTFIALGKQLDEKIVEYSRTHFGTIERDKNMVKLFKDGNSLALQTNATNERDFTENFALALEDYITSNKYEGKHETTAYLKGFVEICCKLRGYKAEVQEQRLLTFGEITPSNESCVVTTENGKTKETIQNLQNDDDIAAVA